MNESEPKSVARKRDPESVGPAFAMAAMLRARERTFEAVGAIAGKVRPGMSEGEATAMAQGVLEAMGMERLWHKNLVRFGPRTR